MSGFNVDDKLVKRVGDPNDLPLTPEQADEWVKCAQDKMYFFENYVYVQGQKGKTLFKPRSYQKRAIEAMTNNRFVVALMGRQSGKALALDTVVPTPSGYTTMGEIKVGDYVIGDDGNPVMVDYVSPVMNNHTCYKVKFSTGEEIVADAEHLWTVNRKKRRTQTTMTTQQLLDCGVIVGKKNEAKFSINCVKPVSGTTDPSVDPYLFGYWLGDGNSGDSRITCGERDLGHILAYKTPDTIREYSDGVYTLRYDGLFKELREMGCLGNKHIPVSVLRASYDYRLKVLQGIMDSDGSVSPTGKIEITLKNFELVNDIHELISSMGIRLSCSSEKMVKTFSPEGVVYHRLSFTAFRSVTPVFKMQRKLDRMKDIPEGRRRNSTFKRQITSIELVDSVPVRCIRVMNSSHLFCVTRSYIPTHNTTTVGMDCLHDMIFNADYRVGLTSYRSSAVLDFMDRIRYAYEALPWWMKPAVSIYNRFSIKFDNGSSVISEVTAENTFRGKSLLRIVSDELAFTKPAIADAFMASLLPSLEADGDDSTTRLNVISTPNGTEGAFPSLWFGAVVDGNGFTPVEVKYEEVPGRTPEFESKMIKKMGRDKFEQEFKNRFIGSGGTLVSSRIMESIQAEEPVRIEGDLEIYVDSFKGRKLAMSCDVAEGINEDNHVMQIFDIDTFEQVAEFANNTLPQTFYFKEIVKTIKLLFKEGAEEVFYTVENNGLGQGIMRLIENSQDNGLGAATLISDVGADGMPLKRLGMLTTGKSKLAGCMQLKDMIEGNILKLKSKKLLTELKFFVKSGASFAAERGAKDDRVMACVIFCNMLPQLANYEESVDKAINDVNEDDETWGISF